MKPYFEAGGVVLYHGGCLEVLRGFGDSSVDAVVTDPPYGYEKTKLVFDAVGASFDHAVVLDELKRVTIRRGALCLFCAPPFSAFLIVAGIEMYRYSWYYEKARGANVGNCKHQPLRVIEEVAVFSQAIASPNQFSKEEDVMIYHPPLVNLSRPFTRQDKPHHVKVKKYQPSCNLHNARVYSRTYNNSTPTNIFYAATDGERGHHETQKPIVVCEYLIRTYSENQATILDPFAGSGTTGVAAIQLGRRAVLIEREERYCEIAARRLEAALQQPPLFIPGATVKAQEAA